MSTAASCGRGVGHCSCRPTIPRERLWLRATSCAAACVVPGLAPAGDSTCCSLAAAEGSWLGASRCWGCACWPCLAASAAGEASGTGTAAAWTRDGARRPPACPACSAAAAGVSMLASLSVQIRARARHWPACWSAAQQGVAYGPASLTTSTRAGAPAAKQQQRSAPLPPWACRAGACLRARPGAKQP